LAEGGFEAVLREATGVSLGASLNKWVEGTDELPLARLLAPMGVTLKLTAPDPSPSLGVRLATRSGDLAIASAYSGGAAQRAGLSAGDLLVACDGLRIDEKALKGLLSRKRPGDTVVLHAFRRDELMRFDVQLDTPAASEASLVATAGPNTLREDWLSAVSRKARAARRPAQVRA
jgi:predicted metalloprotease with PDZ domain